PGGTRRLTPAAQGELETDRKVQIVKQSDAGLRLPPHGLPCGDVSCYGRGCHTSKASRPRCYARQLQRCDVSPPGANGGQPHLQGCIVTPGRTACDHLTVAALRGWCRYAWSRFVWPV